ncbi:MAG: glycosyltransferase family 2 protein [Bacteroidota bacterium]
MTAQKPFISAFTIVRNAVLYDYPIIESIQSILPIVDEYVVAVGKSDDDTLPLIQQIGSDKLKIIETVWDDSLREGGRVLAVETNKAFAAVSAKSDWCFYLQGDEVVHEKDHQAILDACTTYLPDKRVEGLLFRYLHFYGSYNFTGDTRSWYRNEIRVIRNDKRINSYRDAQGFRIENRKLNVKPIQAHIYHYGWVRDPRKQQAKQKTFHRYWHSDEWMKENVSNADAYDYSTIESLQPFTGTHPAVMNERLQRMNWKFTWDASNRKLGAKKWLLYSIEKLTGIRLFEYRNYRVI